jgi:hypothetical protein
VGCPDDNPFWLNLHPFLRHYLTRSPAPAGGFTCTPTGTSGAWNAATGNSGGFHGWNVDLTPFAGKQIEVSITYVTDPNTQGLGVFVDDAKIIVGGATVAQTGFESADISPFSVAGPPSGSPGNSNNWTRSASVGFADGPGIRTDHSVLWGFGLEGVTGADTRAKLLGDALGHLGVSAP